MGTDMRVLGYWNFGAIFHDGETLKQAFEVQEISARRRIIRGQRQSDAS